MVTYRQRHWWPQRRHGSDSYGDEGRGDGRTAGHQTRRYGTKRRRTTQPCLRGPRRGRRLERRRGMAPWPCRHVLPRQQARQRAPLSPPAPTNPACATHERPPPQKREKQAGQRPPWSMNAVGCDRRPHRRFQRARGCGGRRRRTAATRRGSQEGRVDSLGYPTASPILQLTSAHVGAARASCSPTAPAAGLVLNGRHGGAAG